MRDQSTFAQGFDLDEMMEQREAHNEAAITAAIKSIHTELQNTLRPGGSVTVNIPDLTEFVAAAVLQRMKNANAGKAKWNITMRKYSGGFSFDFAPSRVGTTALPDDK